MFRKNTKHIQSNLFGISTLLPTAYVKRMEESQEHAFYELIFCNIREGDFSCLYSEKKSRPNAAVNCLVSAILLYNKNRWTVEKLFDNMRYNLLTKTALGLHTFDEMPFNEATFFNFQNRLNQHFIATGENLLERVFDHLTADQLKTLGVKTSIQRTDSFQAASNIRTYSRLQLLVEMLIRIHRVLTDGRQKATDDDKAAYDELFAPYVHKSSGQFIYRLEQSDMPAAFTTLAGMYHRIHAELLPRYSTVEIFATFERVFEEHFAVVQEKIILKATAEIPCRFAAIAR